MKFKVLVSAGLLAAGLSVPARADDMKITLPGSAQTPAAQAPAATPAAAPAAAPAPAAPAATFTEAQVVEELGWIIGKRSGSSEFELTPDQVQAMIKGFSAAALGKDAPYEPEKIGPSLDGFIQRKQTAYLGKLKQKGLAESAAFLTEIKKKPGVVVLPDGLCYEILKPGDGPAPKPTDIVTVNYEGKLINNQVFDSSANAGKPVEIELDHVIPGWTEGLQKVSKGGKIRLYIPPQLAYGDEGNKAIPPSSTLIFEVELLDIKAGAPEAPVAQPAPAPAPAQTK